MGSSPESAALKAHQEKYPSTTCTSTTGNSNCQTTGVNSVTATRVCVGGSYRHLHGHTVEDEICINFTAYSCPSGQVWSEDQQQCIEPLTCENGSVPNADNTDCECPPHLPNEQYTGDTLQCFPACAANEFFFNGHCWDNCDENSWQMYQGGECVNYCPDPGTPWPTLGLMTRTTSPCVPGTGDKNCRIRSNDLEQVCAGGTCMYYSANWYYTGATCISETPWHDEPHEDVPFCEQFPQDPLCSGPDDPLPDDPDRDFCQQYPWAYSCNNPSDDPDDDFCTQNPGMWICQDHDPDDDRPFCEQNPDAFVCQGPGDDDGAEDDFCSANPTAFICVGPGDDDESNFCEENPTAYVCVGPGDDDLETFCEENPTAYACLGDEESDFCDLNPDAFVCQDPPDWLEDLGDATDNLRELLDSLGEGDNEDIIQALGYISGQLEAIGRIIDAGDGDLLRALHGIQRTIEELGDQQDSGAQLCPDGYYELDGYCYATETVQQSGCDDFHCEGGAIHCAIARIQWENYCFFQAPDDSSAFDSAVTQAGTDFDAIVGTESDVIDLASGDEFLVGAPQGACPAPIVIPILTGTVTLDVQPLCDLAVIMRPLFLILCLLVGGRIVLGGL